jgi:DNA methylase
VVSSQIDVVRGKSRRQPDLDFTASGHLHATHAIHPFAARCPPPLARWAINRFSDAGDIVLDPMVGSGTTMVEAVLSGREAWGADIDPLARLIAQVKSTPVDPDSLTAAVRDVGMLLNKGGLDDGWRPAIPNLRRWFRSDVASDLAAIRVAISQVRTKSAITAILWVAFSSLIVARTSVANARDLVHSRHHYQRWRRNPEAIDRFVARLNQYQKSFEAFKTLLPHGWARRPRTAIVGADARKLRIPSGSVDLVFTSPPYGSALDYTRAHMFAVSWMPEILGIDPAAYRLLGRRYVGSERAPMSGAETSNSAPPTIGLSNTDRVVASLADHRERAWILYRYFRDMQQVLSEAFRVVKPEGHVVLVVCPSNIRRVAIPTPELLAEAIVSIRTPDGDPQMLALYERTLHDRRRVMPYLESAFGVRMRTEYVLVARKRRRLRRHSA